MGKKQAQNTKRRFDAIVVGASWGGMDAVIQIFSDLPKLYPIPIIVVIHRQRNTKSSLCEILSNHISIPIKEIDDKEPIVDNMIFLAPANYHVLIEKNKTFALDVSANVLHSRPSIDVLFESASIVFDNKLLGILLTGANSDGSEGLKTIGNHKGTTIVQDPEEALINTMPVSALNKTKVDHIFSLKEIQNYLLEIL